MRDDLLANLDFLAFLLLFYILVKAGFSIISITNTRTLK